MIIRLCFQSLVIIFGDDGRGPSFGAMIYRCMEAAKILEEEGVSAEVIDLRTIVPFDQGLIMKSLARDMRNLS